MTTQSQIPLKWYVPFANGDASRVELPVTTADPTRASQTLGFPPLTMQPPESGGVPPQGEDFNGGMNQVARVAWWVLLGGGWTYDGTFATNSNIGGYPNGAVLQSADFKGNWISVADNNQNNPDTNGTGWVPGYQYGATTISGLTGGTVTATPAQAAKNSIILTGTLTSALTLVLPAWIKNWEITNSTSGAFVTIVKTAAGSGTTIPQNGVPTTARGDGTNINGNANTAGRLLRTSVYTIVSGTQQVSVDGGAFTATGATTFTPLAGAAKWEVEATGGGGGCGGTSATSASQVTIVGGGSAAAYARSIYTTMTTQSVTVGAAGAAGAAGNNSGGTGGTTTFGALISTPGGNGSLGGGPLSASATNTSINPPATQSNAPTGGNVLSTVGTCGQPGLFVGSGSSPYGGAGGSGPLGSGGGYGTAGTPKPGTGFGAGAGGSAAQPSAAAAAGAAGAPGAVIVREYS